MVTHKGGTPFTLNMWINDPVSIQVGDLCQQHSLTWNMRIDDPVIVQVSDMWQLIKVEHPLTLDVYR